MSSALYKARNPVRFVTAAALFDGHDASINIIRRLLQAAGCEVIHLGHNRSVDEIVTAAIQEDAQGIAVSSYQGGHVDFLKFMKDLLRERGRGILIMREFTDSLDYDRAADGRFLVRLTKHLTNSD